MKRLHRSISCVLIVLTTGLTNCALSDQRTKEECRVTAMLEKRWSPELICQACTADARVIDEWRSCGSIVPPGDGTRGCFAPAERWGGEIHPQYASQLARCYWYGCAVSGRLDSVYVRASKGNAVWYLEAERREDIGKPLSIETVLMRRIKRSLWCAVVAHRVNPIESLGDLPDLPPEYDELYALVGQHAISSSVVREQGSTNWLEYREEGEHGILRVTLDQNTHPRDIFINGKRCHTLEGYYREWAEAGEWYESLARDAVNLRDIVKLCRNYAEAHNARLPDSWAKYDSGEIEMDCFLSATSTNQGGKMADVMTWTDFKYNMGVSLTSAPATIVAVSPPDHYGNRRGLVARLSGDVDIITAEAYRALVADTNAMSADLSLVTITAESFSLMYDGKRPIAVGVKTNGFDIVAMTPDELTLKRGDKVIRLPKGRRLPYNEYVVTVMDNVNRKQYEARIGSQLTIGSRTFAVGRVNPNEGSCILRDVDTGETQTIRRPAQQNAAPLPSTPTGPSEGAR